MCCLNVSHHTLGAGGHLGAGRRGSHGLDARQGLGTEWPHQTTILALVPPSIMAGADSGGQGRGVVGEEGWAPGVFYRWEGGGGSG